MQNRRQKIFKGGFTFVQWG